MYVKKLKWEGFFHGCYKNGRRIISSGKGHHDVGIGDKICLIEEYIYTVDLNYI